MDPTLAIVAIVAAVADMSFNDCPTGCFAASSVEERYSFQGSAVIFKQEIVGEELYFGYDADTRYGPLQPTYGASATFDGDVWVGAGAKWTTRNHFDSDYFMEVSVMPGFQLRGDGPDIGGALQFRSALGAGVVLDNGATVTMLFDHRSNADTQTLNPGLETLGIRYAIPLE